MSGDPVSVNRIKKYILLNKPSGYVCTKALREGEHSVMELIPDKTLFPVGRLDKNTTGLLLLTNDGDFANMLMHPSSGVSKKYLAYCMGLIAKEEMDKIRSGIMLSGRKTMPCKAVFLSYNKNKNLSAVEITIHEGRNRQVRRMFASIGHDVKHLSRIGVGDLKLKGVKEGTFRNLTKAEILALNGAVSDHVNNGRPV